MLVLSFILLGFRCVASLLFLDAIELTLSNFSSSAVKRPKFVHLCVSVSLPVAKFVSG